MKVLLITFDLKQPGDKYLTLCSTIKTASYWWHYLENIWLIATDEPPKDWYAKLISLTYKGDNLLIIEVKPNYYGLLPKEAWDWMSQYLGPTQSS